MSNREGVGGAAAARYDLTCSCGAVVHARGPAALVAALREAFEAEHHGEGHAPSTPRKAYQARAKSERAHARSTRE